MSEATIAVVVVTYNRKKLLMECLGALLSGTRLPDKIILVDNGSTDGTSDLLQEKGYLENSLINYVCLPENTGGAGGFYEGVKYGYEAGYDWLWLMDDDAEPKKDALEKLSEYLYEPNVSALANLKLDQTGNIIHTHLGFFDSKDNKDNFDFDSQIPREIENKAIEDNKALEIAFSSFVGIMISKKAIEKIGFPKKELFIRGDDLEYCLRLIPTGKILLITNSVILHKEAPDRKEITKKFLGKISNRTAYDRLWLAYYETRNVIWLRKNYASNIKFYVRLFKNYFRSLIAILLLDDNKFKRIHFLTEAYRDGLEGKFDNFKPKLLYGKS
jgi:GT2 family glycosyltransferase